jgi:polysaccharide pyruvyl transferase WcaK-like protein
MAILDRRSIKWKLFINGSSGDYKFATDFLKKMNLPETKLLERPTEGKQLVRDIASFKGIIAARLHANIIATALDIPSIGLVWNNKLTAFGRQLGIEERFIPPRKLKFTAHIVDMLEKALTLGYDRPKIEQLKQKSLNYLKSITLDR